MSNIIKQRINQLLFETGKTLYQVRIKATIPRSTINTIMQEKCNNVSLKTIMLLCIGFEISLSHFFDSELFNLKNFDID